MRTAIYYIIKKAVQFAFYCYYKRIHLVDMHKVPDKKAVLFLPNHQNALMDPLIIAACSNRKPYFLTRSDVFVNAALNEVFKLLRMIPIYRIRDGRNAVPKNEAIFSQCARLLANNKAIVIFPEGNHHIRKFVRPLSKGFTRILHAALEKDPELEIFLIPVGINYQASEAFPDKSKFIFDDPISLRGLVGKKEWHEAIPVIKESIFNRLVTLTTHIQPEEDYDTILEYLHHKDIDFTNPGLANSLVNAYSKADLPTKTAKRGFLRRFTDLIFLSVNLPVLLPWKYFLKGRIKEIEFISTYRFAYSIVVFPVYYAGLFAVFSTMGMATAVAVPLLVFLHNLVYVKLS